MQIRVEETSAFDPLSPRRLVHHDPRRRTYALAVADDPTGTGVPIGYCPWCGTKLRRIRARGIAAMSPALCRSARKAVSMTQRQVADAIGESLETVFRYEAGKPTDEAVAEKLLDFFQDFQIATDRSGRIGWYQT